MTRERLLELLNLVDEYNNVMYYGTGLATLSYNRIEARIFINNERGYVAFSTFDLRDSNHITYNDTNLEQAEKYMREKMKEIKDGKHT